MMAEKRGRNMCRIIINTRPKEKKVRLTDILYIFELIKRQRTGMNRFIMISNLQDVFF
jgi:hypothetical protein